MECRQAARLAMFTYKSAMCAPRIRSTAHFSDSTSTQRCHRPASTAQAAITIRLRATSGTAPEVGRPAGATGLAEVELLLRERDDLMMIASRLSDAGKPPEEDERHLIAFDPWDNRLRLTSTQRNQREKFFPLRLFTLIRLRKTRVEEALGYFSEELPKNLPARLSDA
jgi:hypothetical protein